MHNVGPLVGRTYDESRNMNIDFRDLMQMQNLSDGVDGKLQSKIYNSLYYDSEIKCFEEVMWKVREGLRNEFDREL